MAERHEYVIHVMPSRFQPRALNGDLIEKPIE